MIRSSGRYGIRAWAALVIILCAAFAGDARGISSACAQPDEHEVQAAYLLHVLKLVSWPPESFPDAVEPIEIAVIGKDPFDGSLEESLRGRRIEHRPIVIRQRGPSGTIPSCHVLVVGEEAPAEVFQWLAGPGTSGVLTIGFDETFTARGGMFRFYHEQQKVRLEINTDAVTRSGLHVSCRLLKLARLVHFPAAADNP